MNCKSSHISSKVIRLRLLVLSFAMVVFSLIVSYQKGAWWLWLFPLALVLILFAILAPMRLGFLIQAMEQLNIQMGKASFAVLFYGVLTPMSGLFRLIRPTTIFVKIDQSKRSYWTNPVDVSFDREQFKKQF